MMHGMAGGCSHNVGLLLLTWAVGYGVLVLADKQNRPLDVLGRLVGGVILLVSFLGLLCAGFAALRCGKSMGCGDKGRGVMCPYSGKPSQPADSVQQPAPQTPPQ